MNELYLNNPVFICGLGRSGSTLLLKLLDHHPQLVVFPVESRFFRDIAPISENPDSLNEAMDKALTLLGMLDEMENSVSSAELLSLTRKSLSDTGGPLTKKFLEMLVSSYAKLTNQGQFANAWVEKTPRNERYYELINRYFPGAKYLYLIRDPRAVYYSHSKTKKYTPPSPDMLARQWLKSYKTYLAIEENNKESTLLVKYEDVIGNTKITMQNIAHFLNIEWNDSLCTPTENNGPWKGNSFNPEENTSNKVRPATADAWNNQLKPGDIASIESVVGRRLPKLGY